MRALIVEDLSPMRHLTKKMLSQTGTFELIDEAETGEDGWKKISECEDPERYGLVVCDVRIEGIGGIGLLKHCRSHPDFRFLPFLMISASSEVANIAAVLGEWEANDFIVKPFSFELFQNRVETLLRRYQGPDEALFREVEKLKENGATEGAIHLIEQAETAGRISLAKWLNVKGECLMKAGQVDEAAKEFEKAISVSNVYIAAYKNYAMAQQLLGDAEKAAETLEQAEKISPTDDDRTFLLGKIMLQTGNMEGGKKYLTNLIKRCNKGKKEATLKTVGQMFIEGGLFEEAEEIFTAALEFNANDLELYNRLGMALRQQGKHDEALQCYLNALKAHPDHPGILYNLGVLEIARKKYKAARSYFMKALSIDPKFVEAKEKLEKIQQALSRK